MLFHLKRSPNANANLLEWIDVLAIQPMSVLGVGACLATVWYVRLPDGFGTMRPLDVANSRQDAIEGDADYYMAEKDKRDEMPA